MPRQEPRLPLVEKRHLTLQPFSLVRNILPYRNVPGIIVKGRWLEEAGFNISDTVTIIVRNKKLIIQLDGN
ncbi:type I addiction module toxin, SymE family [Odoribacter sp. OF09-27XD]|nr:type I addiction module toxin, SymE family [Odoribacter sp. OF09-27XD]